MSTIEVRGLRKTYGRVVAVDGIEEADFQRLAEDAKQNCPISQALKGVDITLKATLA